MKKILSSLLLVPLLAFVFIFGACSNREGESEQTGETYTVMFNYNYQGAPSSEIKQVKGGTAVAEPEDPERDGYEFIDWFTDKNCSEGKEYDFSLPVTQNTVLYAGWQSTSATVTFNYNYVGAPAMVTESVTLGDKLTEPEQPRRDRYSFTGWFTDAACTAENKFDFSTEINSSLTLYAGWIQTEATVTFDYNYEGAPASSTQDINVGDKISLPAEPERVGYDFLGWFTDAECTLAYDFESTPAGDFILYAGWAIKVLTVSFNPNYAGAPDVADQKVEYGKTVEEPVLERDGYVCIWQLDGVEYDFSTPVTQNIELTASWQSESSDSFTVTFYNNYDGASSAVYLTQQVKKFSKPTVPASPERDGYYFVGWFADAACTEEFDFNERLTSGNAEAYAKWFKDYVFEAEYTDFTDKVGYGYSVNLYGTGMIQKDDGSAQASNGYYVSALYYNGAYLEFVIEAEEEVSDAIVMMSIGAEYFDMTFSPENVKMLVNGAELSYDAVTLIGDSADITTTSRRPFTEVVMTTPAHLVKGTNTIRISVENDHDYGTGTMKATAPMVDCIHVCTDIGLSWTPITSNTEGKQ